MKTPSQWVLKVILSHYPPDRRSALAQYLPEIEIAALQAMPSFEGEIASEEPSLFDRVHWSWFLPILKDCPPEEQNLFLSALPSLKRESLKKELGISRPTENLKEKAKSFLVQTLTEKILKETKALLPMSFLPPSPLNVLLNSSKRELIRLIDFLSLFDLAAELRQIVDTKTLKKIYSFLSASEKKFLKHAAAATPSFSAMRLKFEGWDGSKESFRHLLHKRGLARLGGALSAQSPDLSWYLCHQLDIGRGSALAKFCIPEAPHDLSETIVRQIEQSLAYKGGS